MDTRLQTMPPSFRDDTIARPQLSYIPSHRAKGAAFLGNNSTINRVCHSESKIDRASIDGQQYKEIVFLDGVPYHQAASNSTGNARLLGHSASGGNDSTMMRHQEQLLYDDVTSRRGEIAFRGNNYAVLYKRKPVR
jgi:hypothetical protein